mmetsp:Transcript_23951/g.53157  ORF Transcript_23951/g.53157 Transcript_23951/m.53157 type:complete len:251 (-) Transcript_23951:2576-3328(-)
MCFAGLHSHHAVHPHGHLASLVCLVGRAPARVVFVLSPLPPHLNLGYHQGQPGRHRGVGRCRRRASTRLQTLAHLALQLALHLALKLAPRHRAHNTARPRPGLGPRLWLVLYRLLHPAYSPRQLILERAHLAAHGALCTHQISTEPILEAVHITLLLVLREADCLAHREPKEVIVLDTVSHEALQPVVVVLVLLPQHEDEVQVVPHVVVKLDVRLEAVGLVGGAVKDLLGYAADKAHAPCVLRAAVFVCA